MPIPQGQRDQLNNDMTEHREIKERLSKQAKKINDEMKVHDTVLELGNNAGLLEVLDALHDDPQLAEQIAPNPKTYFNKKKIKLPNSLRNLTVTKSTQNEPGIEGEFKDGVFTYKISWDRGEGFSIDLLEEDDV